MFGMVGMSVILSQYKCDNFSESIELAFFRTYKPEISENLNPHRRNRKCLAYHRRVGKECKAAMVQHKVLIWYC